MAKHSVIKDIKAKPNERGRTSHLPLVCSTKKCDCDFYVSYAKGNGKHKRKCAAHFASPPQTNSRAAKTHNLLRSMGLI